MAEYIDREVAKKALGDAHFKNYGNAIMVIMDIPTADVRPVVRGKWEHFGSDVFRCSECGYGIQPWNIGVNFCPNCGADMREES